MIDPAEYQAACDSIGLDAIHVSLSMGIHPTWYQDHGRRCWAHGDPLYRASVWLSILDAVGNQRTYTPVVSAAMPTPILAIQDLGRVLTTYWRSPRWDRHLSFVPATEHHQIVTTQYPLRTIHPSDYRYPLGRKRIKRVRSKPKQIALPIPDPKKEPNQ